jgi:hypothetical protein
MHLGLELLFHSPRHQLKGLREQVIKQTQEDGGVVAGQLAQVEVAQGTQQHLHQ